MKLHILLLLLLPFLSFSQEIKNKKKYEFLALPTLGYTPETSLSVGFSGFYNSAWGTAKNNKISSHTFYARYTLKKQISFGITSDNWFSCNQNHIKMSWDYNKFPYLFYPLDDNFSNNPESYTSKFFNGFICYERLIAQNLYAGVQLESRIEKIVKVEEGKLLASQNSIGSNTFSVWGIAPTLIYDSRDNTLYPTNGDFHQIKIRHFNKNLSNQESFTLFDFDFRKYFTLNKYNHILASNLAYQFSDNKNIPFQMLPRVGNEYIQRGYYEGRYRATNRLVLKTEYRLPLNHRFKASVFGSISSVNNSFRKLFTTKLHPACGIGFRYRLGNNGMHIRVDLAYGMSFSPYVNVGEAF